MKIDRRCFLSLGIGAAAGITLSPLPWKATDDSSIWTQNWPWTPVPPDGAITYEDSVCTLCPGGCGITVCKVGNRVIKIEGMEGHPVNEGGICSLGLSGPQLLYSPVRIKTPLKKENGKWREISWDDAISEVATRLSKLRTENNPHTLACMVGTDMGTVPALIKRFLTAFGSPNFIKQISAEDSYALAIQRMQGVYSVPGFDFENADYIVSFGSGMIEGWGSPVRMLKENSNWKNDRRKKTVQIDPRLSNTAAGADQWIAIKPGTETFLALGFANVILREFLYNPNFINYYSSGFETWKEKVLADFDPDQVAQITGVNSETIKSIGREFARSTKPIAICGRGKGSTPVSMAEATAVHALNALVGNINQKGGVWAVPKPDYISWPEIQIDSTAANGLAKNRIDEAGTGQYPDAVHLPNRIADAVLSGKDGLKALFISETNPCHSMHHTEAVQKALANIPFKVSFSSYMDDTTEMADIVLPNHIWLERFEDIPVTAGLAKPVVGLSKPVIDPQFNTKHTGDVIISIAKKMGGSISAAFPWDNYEVCIKDTLGEKWDILEKNGYFETGTDSPEPWSKGFQTDSGKFQFPNLGRLMANHPLSSEGGEKEYPLVLIPIDSMRLSAGYAGSSPFMIKIVSNSVLVKNDIVIEINPQTAQKHGLSEGVYAQLTTQAGTAKVKIHLFDGIMPGVVAMAKGLGHSGYDAYLAGKGDNYNRLVKPVEDPASGFDTAWGVRAKLVKA